MKYELNHDVVAKQVFEKASADMKARRKVELLVKTAHEFYQKRNALMTKEQLEEVRPFRQTLNLSDIELAFIDKSESTLKAAQRRKFLITMGVIVALSVLAGLAIWQWRKAVDRERTAESGRLAISAQQQFSAFNFNDAFNLAQEALAIDPDNLIASEILSQIFHRPFNNRLTPLSTATIQESKSVTQVNLSEDGHFTAVTLSDSTVKIYDVSKDAQLVGSISACDTRFKTVFSPNNTHILTLKSDSLIQISTLDGKDAVILRGHSEYVSGAIFYNSDTIISWANDGYIKMWSTQGTFLRDIGKQGNFVKSVEISNDRVHLLSIDDGHVAAIWSMNEDELPFQISHLSSLNTATFWNKDSVLLVGSEGVEMWSGKQKREVVRPLPLQNIGNNAIFSANADNLLYVVEDSGYTCVTRIHDYFDFFGGNAKQNVKLKVFQKTNNMKDFEPQGFLKIMSQKPNVDANKVGFFNVNYVWTISKGSNEVVLRDVLGNPMAVLTHPTPVESVVFTNKNLVAATFSTDGIIKIWKQNATDLMEIVGIVNDRKVGVSTAVYFSPDNKSIVTTGKMSPMKWFDSKGQLSRTFYDFNIEYLAFSPNSESTIALPYIGEPVMLDRLGQTLRKLGINGSFRGVQFSPDGSHFLVYEGKKVSVFTEKGDLVQDKIEVKDTLLSVCFSTDNSHILTASRDSLLSEWDIQGNLVRHIIEHDRSISFELSPDGKYILTGNNDNIAILRDFSTGKIIHQLKGEKPNNYIISTEFLPDGKTILIKDNDNEAVIYDLNGKIVQQNLFNGKLADVFFFHSAQELLIVFKDSYELWTKDNKRITTYGRITQYDAKPTKSVAIAKDDTRFIMAFDDGSARQYLTLKGITEWLKQHPQMRFNDLEKKRYSINAF